MLESSVAVQELDLAIKHALNGRLTTHRKKFSRGSLRGRRSQKLLYENLHVQTKMAILSRRPILLAILLYEQFVHLTQINLYSNAQLLSTQQHAYQSFLGYFLV